MNDGAIQGLLPDHSSGVVCERCGATEYALEFIVGDTDSMSLSTTDSMPDALIHHLLSTLSESILTR